MARDYISVEQAIPLPGLRVAFTQGVPGPWGQAVREILDLKKIDYAPVIQIGGAPNEELKAWTGQNSAPCAVFNDERPRSHWSEILMLAERLAPEPRLIPSDERQRMEMFGILHELCAEDGFGWSARLLMLEAIEKAGAGEVATVMRRKFSSNAALDHAARRAATIMAALAERLEGRDYFVGDALSAADIYWTAFSNLVAPMAEADCPMPDYYRAWAGECLASIGSDVPAILLDHRERILHRHLSPPMWF